MDLYDRPQKMPKEKRENRDHCNLCKDGGELICCDNCPRSFHPQCLKIDPNLIPDGDWYCHKCMYLHPSLLFNKIPILKNPIN